MNSRFDRLEEVLERCTNYGGRYLAACCPFHDDENPSFFVYSSGYYRCAACGARGRAEDLLSLLSGRVIKYKRENLCNPFTIWLKKDSLKNVLHQAWRFTNRNLIYERYYLNRGIDSKFRKALGLGYRDGWYTIPFFSPDGKVIGGAARADPEIGGRRKYMLPGGQSTDLLYCPNWRLIEHAKVIVVTFGYFDAITLAIHRVAAFSSVSGKQVNPILFDPFRKPIYIWPDKGEEIEGHRVASRLGWRGHIIEPNWPDDSKDVNELWVKHPGLFLQLIEEYRI